MSISQIVVLCLASVYLLGIPADYVDSRSLGWSPLGAAVLAPLWPLACGVNLLLELIRAGRS